MVTNGNKIWALYAEINHDSNDVEMDYLSRSSKMSKLQHITNEEVRHWRPGRPIRMSASR